MRLLTAAIFIFFFSFHLSAQLTSNGAGGGDWDDPATWDGVNTPGATDNVVIADGDVVTVSEAISAGDKSALSLTIQGSGNLDFDAEVAVQISTDLTMSGTSSISGTSNNSDILILGDFDIPSGSATLGGISFNLPLGQTTVEGTLIFSDNTGAKNMGDVLIDGGTLTFSNGGDLSLSGNERVSMTQLEMRDGAAITGDANNERVDIDGAFNITSGTASIGGHQINANGTTTITGTLEFTSSTGNKTFNNVLIDGGTINYSDTELFNITGDLEARDGATINGTLNGHRIDVAGAFNVTSGTVTIAGNQLNANGTSTVSAVLNLTGTNRNKTFADLTIEGGTVNFLADEFIEVTNNLEMLDGASITGNANAQRVLVANEFNVTSGTATIGGIRLDAQGDTNVDGTLSFTSETGNKTINNISVSASGTFDNTTVPEFFSFTGDLANDGTWNGCVVGDFCLYDLESTSGEFSGTGTFNLSRIRVNTPGSYTNNGTISTNENIVGSGEFINGSTGVLELSENGNYAISTFTLNTVGNTVRYFGGTNELIDIGPFYNLEVEMDDASVICQVNGNDVTVGGDLTVIQGLFRIVSANTLDVSGNMTIQAGEFLVNDIDALVNVGGDLSNSGAEFDFNDGEVAVTGDVILTGGSLNKNQSDDLQPSVLSATNFTATDILAVLAEGEVNLTGDMSIGEGGEVRLNQSTSTLDITGDLDVSGTGVADFNNGTVSFTDMDITSGGRVELAGNPTFTSTGTITVTNGTFVVQGAGTPTFNNISVGASGVWNVTAGYDPTINGNLHNIGSFTGCNALGCNYTFNSVTGTITGSAPLTNVSDVIIADGSTYTNTNTGGLNITDRLIYGGGTGTFVNGANGLLVYEGATSDITISNFTANDIDNTVIYRFSGANQDLPTPTANTYYNLTIDGEDTNDAIMVSDLTIDGTLTLGDGDVVLADNDLTLGIDGNVVGGGLSGYLRQNGAGRVIKEYTTGGNSATINIPIGDNTVYAPMTFALVDSDAIPASAEIEFEYVAGAHPDRSNDNTANDGDDDGTAATDYLNGYWNFTSSTVSNPTFNATLDYTNVGATGNEANLQAFLLRTFTPEGGGSTIDWFGIGTKPAVGEGSVNPTSNIVTYSGVIMGNTDNSDIGNTSDAVTLYAMDNSGDRLPITLIDFTAIADGSQVKLDWSTASETNNDYFTIERSTNGLDFRALLTMDGAGNSDGVIEYQAIDPFPISGRSYYRLKQTDFNGQFEYSKIVAIDFSGVEGVYDFYLMDNPVAGGERVDIQFSESLSNQPITIQMVGVNGKVYHQEDGVVDSALQMALVAPRPSGMYVIQLITNQGRISKKLVVR